jgi:hypothetical protein
MAITEEMVKVAERNSPSAKEVTQLLLSRDKNMATTEKVFKCAAMNGSREVMQLLLSRDGKHDHHGKRYPNARQ